MRLTPLAQMLEQSETTEVELSLIDAFPEHPFRVQADEDMERLIASIRESGVLVPVILRRGTDGRYQTIAGHRRCFACRQLDLERIPAVIKDVTDEEAVVWMVDSNIQRTTILPSEKAKAYRMKMDALAKQGKRSDLRAEADETASRQPVGKWQKETAEQIGLDAGDSGRKVQRYLRLNHLIPGLLEQVDEKKLPFLSGVELSYVPEAQQETLFRYLAAHPCTITVAQAKQLRELGEASGLTERVMADVLECRKKGKSPAGRSREAKDKDPGRRIQTGKKETSRQSLSTALEPFARYFPKGSKPSWQKKIIRALLEKWKKGEIQL